MSRGWATVILLGVLTIFLKAAAPILAGGRQIHRGPTAVLSHLAPALFAALIVTQVFARARVLVIDARAAGLIVALLGSWRRAPPLAILVSAVAVTAAFRHFA
jgi:branched-subunit amino acid transport protein